MPGFIEAMSGKKALIISATAVLLVTLAAYANSFDASFQFDDFHQIVNNHNIRNLSKAPLFFVESTRGSAYSGLKGYRPVTLATFALNYAMAKLDVTGYHAFNFILHITDALLVFVLVMSVLKKAGRDNPSMTALFVAAAFAVHPIQTNSVTYVSGRAVLLASLFYMLGFVSFVKLREMEQRPGRARFVLAALVPAFYLLGLLSKQMAVSLPAAMLAYDLIFTAPARGGITKSLKMLVWYIPVLLAFLAYELATSLMSYDLVSESLEFPVGSYLMSEAGALLMYVRLLFLPVNQCADYNISSTMHMGPAVLASAAALAACLFLLYRSAAKSPATAFFGFWFFLALAPESTFVPIPDIAQEYRLYLPSVGFIAATSLIVSGILKSGRLRRALAVFIIASLALLTFNRNAVWATPYSLWTDTLKKSENPWRAHMGVANALYDQRLFPEAADEYKKAIATGGDNFQLHTAYNDLGLCYYEMGRLDEALTQFRLVVKKYPDYSKGFEHLGMVSFDMGRYEEAAAAFEEFDRRSTGNPVSKYHLGISYLMLGRYKDAQAQLEQAISYGLRSFDVHYNLALALEKQGMRDRALEEARATMGAAQDEAESSQADEVLARLGRRGR